MGSIISIAQSYLLTRKSYTKLNREKNHEFTTNNNRLHVPNLINRKPIENIEAALESNLDLV